ncbi:MAG TPA: glutamate-1-semialdehyde 2,1-aminomutase, partial [Candidatus Hydrogenedentes bacterium]|nr:glutamate-1-semialdehyde 2,1-aminomutase [Candidatus Hydrogenedentota bacterium]
ISAMVGVESLRKDVGRVFHTGSFWFGAGPMAAALATLKELKRLDAPALLRETGEKLLNGMVEVAKSHGYTLKVSGEPSMPYLRITDDPTMTLHQYWCAECTRRGAYFTSHHNWFISTAHTEQDIQKTLEICDAAFRTIKKRFGNGIE